MADIQAVIFDMDGLMIDSEGLQSQSYDKVLREYGADPQLNKYGIIQKVGVRGKDNWQHLKSLHSLAASVDDLLARKDEVYYELIREGVIAMPGILELFADLKEIPVKKAIASSSKRSNIDLIIRHLGISDYFDGIASGEEVVHGKPAPDIYIDAAHKINVDPRNCVALEDAGDGVKAAKAAGMKCIAVPSKYTHDHDFDSADLIVDSIENLSWDQIRSLN